jgi:endoribonuclease Dicer
MCVPSLHYSDRNQNLDSFRSGLSPILISTSALEEGIDVPDCSFVIRFDAFNTTKSHIQGE